MKKTKVTRSGWGLLLTAAMTALLLASPGTALAAGGPHTQSYTEHFHGTLTNELNEQRAPCTGDELQVIENTNIVNHITFFAAGDELWATFTQTSRIAATDEATGVIYTGHSTFWGNFNVNRQNENSTFTGMIRLKGSDGTTILYHVVDHFSLLPGGKVGVEFEKPHLTCGS
jgi:hypothetical protein